ncbi:MAG TPA: hypothetical protein VF060_33370 [Trebonia sp.]
MAPTITAADLLCRARADTAAVATLGVSLDELLRDQVTGTTEDAASA